MALGKIFVVQRGLHFCPGPGMRHPGQVGLRQVHFVIKLIAIRPQVFEGSFIDLICLRQ